MRRHKYIGGYPPRKRIRLPLIQQLIDCAAKIDEECPTKIEKDGTYSITIPRERWDELLSLLGWEAPETPAQMGWIGKNGQP